MVNRTKRYKCILLGILLLLTALLPAARDANADDGVTYIRVLLSTENAGSITMDVSGSYLLSESSRTFTGGKLTVKADGSTVTVTHSSEGLLYSGKTATVERMLLNRSAGAIRFHVVSGTRSFLGNFTITASNGKLNVVNRVPLSHYLYGVVGYEMSNEFPIEALRAQAVAAKGYALLHIGSSGRYDIGDTASDQVYRGYAPEDTNVINAVDSTISDVLYYNDKPLLCFYAASNGGYMLLPGVRWKEKIYDGAYASGPDIYDMKNPSTPRETVFIASDYSERAMGARAFSFLDARMTLAIVSSNAIPEHYHFLGVRSVDAVTSSGEAGYKGDLDHTDVSVRATVRTEMDAAYIPTPTPAWDPTPSPTPENEPTPSPTPPHETPSPTPEPVAPAEGEEGYDPNWQPPAPTELPETPTPTPAWDPTPSPTPEWPATPSPTPATEILRDVPVSFSFKFDELTAAGLYVAENLGIYYAAAGSNGFDLLHARYGHGVGMSQRGAQQMANEGRTYREILQYYYPGAAIVQRDFHSPENVAAITYAPVETGSATGTVVNSTVNLRKAAGTNAKSLEKLPVGTSLTLLGMQGSWYYVTAPSGQTGYVRYDYVQTSGGGIIAKGIISGSAVNYRTGPDTAYESLGKLSENTQLGIYGMENGWYKVHAANTGKDGYVHGDYVTITQSVADTAPAPAATPSPTPLPAGVTPAPIVISVHTPEPSAAPTVPPTPTPVPVYAARGYVNASRVNIRSGASTTTKSFGKLDKDAELGIYEKSGAWYRVLSVASGQTGYIYGKYVTLSPSAQQSAGSAAAAGESAAATPSPVPSGIASQTASTGKGYINSSGVKLRLGSDTSYDSIATLGQNTTVTVLSTNGSWMQVAVKAGGKQGYVFGKYVTMTGVAGQLSENGVITASRLNLRTIPSTGAESHVQTVMERGDVVTVHGTANGWCHVTFGDKSGYCIASCVRMD